MEPTTFTPIVASITDADVISIATGAVVVTAKLAAPMLLAGLVVGLVVSIFQAVTQIQEQTLVFIPKIIAIVAAAAFAGPWMLGTLTSYTTNLLTDIPSIATDHVD